MVVTRYLPIPLLALAFLPTLLVDIPAAADYLNHLSRMYLVTDPASNAYYEVSFAFFANLAMDLIVPKIARLISVEKAAWTFFLLSQVLVVGGAVAIELLVKGRQELSLLAALLCLHTAPFSYGFVNFEFGVGVAVCGIACWIACRPHHWLLRLAVHSLFVGALIVSHFFALGIYGLTLGLYELHRFFAARISWREAMATVAILAGPVLIFLATLHQTGGAIGGSETEWALSWKPLWFALFFNGYSLSLSAGTAAVMIVLIGYLIFSRSLVPSPAAVWIAVGFLIVYLVLPFKIFDSRIADIRALTGALLVVPAFVSIRPDKRPLAHMMLASLIVLNAGYTAYIWLSYRSDYAAMKASFALLQPASFVLVGHSSSTGEIPSTLLTDQPIYRAPVLAVHYASAFVSSLYTIAGTVPIEVRSDLKHLDVDARTETYEPPTLAVLRAVAAGEDVPGAPHYLKNWTKNFQYVYLVGRPTENAFPGVLDELTRHRRFTLYAVRK